jgi:hypothetical protein
MPEKLPHREYGSCFERVYWNNNVAGNSSNADRVWVQVSTGIYHPRITFNWPDQKAEVEQLENMLDLACKIGKGQAKSEIRKVLGIEDPRR